MADPTLVQDNVDSLLMADKGVKASLTAIVSDSGHWDNCLRM